MITRMEEIQRVAEGKGEQVRRAIVITDGDIQILQFIHDYRLLRIEQLEALTGRTYTRVHRRLKGLFDAGFLKRIEIPQKKDIYHVGRRALALLLSHGLITDDEAERRSREHELKPSTLDHEMMIADVHVALELAGRQGTLKLITWHEGEMIRDAFEVNGNPEHRVVIQPDAFFQLKDTCLPEGKNRRTYFLEVDRSTMPTKPREGSRRFRDKVDRYRWFLKCGRPFDRYGVRSVRIITVTLTHQRRDNLSADTNTFLVENDLTGLRKFFLFGSLPDISLRAPTAVFASVFRQPGERQPYPLFPAFAQKPDGA